MEKKEWKKYSKLDKLGFVTYFILAIGFLVGLAYWGFFYNGTYILKKMLTDNFQVIGLIYFTLILLGIFVLAELYHRIIYAIYYPEDKEDKLIRLKKKEYENKYPYKMAILKLKKLKLELRLDKINNKIKHND